MDPNEIIKTAPEIARGAAALGAAIPFTGIVKRMLGPAADEVAQMWVDQVRVYRYGRQLKLLEKAERMAQEAGFAPQAVPPKILFPLLEGASLEDDETLHDMWAALLANASSEMAKSVRPGFISLLREMAPDEAELLISIPKLTHAVEAGKRSRREHPDAFPEELLRRDYVDSHRLLMESRAAFGRIRGEDDVMTDARYEACILSLEMAGLVVPKQKPFRLTGRGVTFLNVCSPPKAKK